MPGKKMDLKKVKKIKIGVNKPSMKVGKGMQKSGRIKGRKKGGRV
tara:strand:+ start:89 stop:223 length:135 start_codon:yes stop_codon:yes gene_type:complete